MKRLRNLEFVPFVKVTSVFVASLALSGVLVVPAFAANAAVSMTEPQPDRYAFSPDTQTVAVGSTVTWTNKSDAPHTVISDSGVFGSQSLQQNQAFGFAFTSPGTFTYHCSIHPYMHGTVSVTAAANSPVAAPAQPPAALPKTGGGGGQLSFLAAIGLVVLAGAAVSGALHRIRSGGEERA